MEIFNYRLSALRYGPGQFVVFRLILGLYLIQHFCMLMPYAGEVFSNEGVFGDARLNFTYGVIPDLLYYLDTPLQVQMFIGALALLSVVFCLGTFRGPVSILLWYGWLCLINRNNLIVNPGMPYIGWLLLMCAFVPAGENRALKTAASDWKLPSWCLFGAWLLLALGYTISGFDKLHSPSWTSGETFSILLENPLCRDTWLRTFTANLPEPLLKFITWSILLAEFLFLPLALFDKTRKYAWMLLTSMHLGILCYIDFADLTTGMLMIHVFTYDVAWFRRKERQLKSEVGGEPFTAAVVNEVKAMASPDADSSAERTGN